MFCKSTNGYCKVFLFLAALAILAGLPSATTTVTLSFPLNNTNTTASTNNFNFTAVSSINVTDLNCSLYFNGVLNRSNITTLNNTVANFTVTGMANGIYNWNVACSNKTGGDIGVSGVYLLTIDSTAPTINVSSPANTSTTTNRNPSFNWTASDALRTNITCNLTIDTAVNRSNLAVTNGTLFSTTATAAFSQGTHNWSVSCWDDLNNTASAGTFNFILSVSPSAVGLGTAGNFVILSKTAISSVPTSAIIGNIGVSPATGASITGLTCAEVNGTIYTVDAAGPACRVVDPAALTAAVSDMETAYTTASGLSNPTATELYSGNLGGRTLAAGIYKWGTGVTIPTDVTLAGNSTDVWVFQIAGNLDISSATSVILTGGASAKNIFWAVAGTTTLGTTSAFSGNILAGPATSTIAMNGAATLNGRALGQKDVTLAAGGNNVSLPTGTLTVALNSPAASLNTSSTSPTFNFTAVSTGTISCSLFIDGVSNRTNSSIASTIATTFTVPGFLNGVHNWSISCNDSLGNTANSATRNFTVDTVAPTVAIQTPVANSKVTASSTPFNFTTADATTGVAYCEYQITGFNLTNTSSCLNFTLNLTDGVKNLYLYATDFAGNKGSTVITFLADNSSTSNLPLNTTTSVTTASSQVGVGVASPAANVTTSSAATNVALNASTIYNSTTFSETLPAITVNASTTLGNVLLQMPANVTLSAGSDWLGTFTLPTVRGSPSTYPTTLGTNTVSGVVEIGVSGTAITLSNAARILIPGKAGQNAGYSLGTSFTQITTTCTTDSQAWADANLAAGGDCVTSNGTDMVIWAKHFGQFISYTTYNPSNSGGSSNSGGGSTGAGAGNVGSSSNSTTYDTGSGTVQLSYIRGVDYNAATGKSTYTLSITNDGDIGTGPLTVTESIPGNVATVSGDLVFSLQPDAFGYAPVSASWNLQNGIAAHQSFVVSYSVAKQTHVLSGFDLAFSKFSAPGSEVPMPGSDRDSHGCIPSAGYTWCEAKQKCLRVWEENCTAVVQPTTPTTPTKPTTPTTPTQPAKPVVPAAPSQQPSVGLSGIALGGVALAVIVVIAVVAAVAFFVFRKKKRGM